MRRESSDADRKKHINSKLNTERGDLVGFTEFIWEN